MDYNYWIRVLLECSPGPWTSDNGEILCKGTMVIAPVIGGDDLPCLDEEDENVEPELRANNELIAHAPQAIGELIVQSVESQMIIVAMRAGMQMERVDAYEQGLRELKIDPSLYRQLKERMTNAQTLPAGK